MLYVFIDDMNSPVITTLLSLSDTLSLDAGTAYVGFTASTGDNMWQAHDLLDWQFRSLHIDKAYVQPTLVGSEGAFECVVETECVHRRDDLHHWRENSLL
jgi:hypothetical protein